MASFEYGSEGLSRVHAERNDKKHFCYFTGFLEGILASGELEIGEIEPLLEQCLAFVKSVAEADAYDIIEDFYADILEAEGIATICEVRANSIDQSCQKSSMNRFLGFCAGIACDDLITIAEAEELQMRISNEQFLLSDPFIKSLQHCLTDALQDEVIDEGESQEICRAITKLVGDCYADTGISAFGNVPDFSDLTVEVDWSQCDGKLFLLSGEFQTKPRKILEDELKAIGLVKAPSMSKKVDFLIVAKEASRDWIHSHKGTKIVKALELRESTGRPDFVTESDLMKAISRSSD